MKRAAFAFIATLAATQAQAQLLQPRCGGWPPGGGHPGIIVGAPGVTCYGQVINRVGKRSMITGVSVLRPPVKGSFRMIGVRDFEYRAAPDFEGVDVIVLRVSRLLDGVDKPYKMRFRATTDAEYARMGGTTSAPPGRLIRTMGKKRPAR
jgi:hypothetical protein